MIDSKFVESVVNEWLADKDYFLVEVTVSAENTIPMMTSNRPEISISLRYFFIVILCF